MVSSQAFAQYLNILPAIPCLRRGRRSPPTHVPKADQVGAVVSLAGNMCRPEGRFWPNGDCFLLALAPT